MNPKVILSAGWSVAQGELFVTYITDGTPWVEGGGLDVKWSAHSREFGEEVSQPFECVRNFAMSHTLVEITSDYIAVGDIMDDGFHGTLIDKVVWGEGDFGLDR